GSPEAVKETTLGAYAHQDVPFEKLVEVLAPQRDLSRTPLFQVMFVLQNAPLPQLRLGETKLYPFDVEAGTAMFDLMLVLEESADDVRGYLEYNTDLFAPPSIERMADHYGILLSSILANPEGRIGTHPMLSQKEREQLLVEWNATTAKIPRQVCFPQIFEQQVARTPDQLAVVDGGRQLTYRQL